MIVDIVFAVCSVSDVVYDWSEVLKPLWNVTLTTMAYVFANSLSSMVPRALDSLTRAQAIFESFSSTCPTALSAKDIVQSLANSLRNMTEHSSCDAANDDPMVWGIPGSLLEEQQTFPAGLESNPSSDPYSVLFPPSMPSASQLNTRGFNSVTMGFGDA